MSFEFMKDLGIGILDEEEDHHDGDDDDGDDGGGGGGGGGESRGGGKIIDQIDFLNRLSRRSVRRRRLPFFAKRRVF